MPHLRHRRPVQLQTQDAGAGLMLEFEQQLSQSTATPPGSRQQQSYRDVIKL
jgi:hypothetical protein